MISSPEVHATHELVADLDRLGDEIAELSAHRDAATARLLDLIREFDARDGWNTGFRSCAAWLSWRVGLDPGAARERVRVARAPSRRRYVARLTTATEAVASRAVACDSVRATTFATGRTAAPPRCRISRCSVVATTARSTRRDMRSIVSPTERSASGDPTARCYPLCRLRPGCPPTQSRFSVHDTTTTGFRSPRGRRCRAG